MYAGGQGRANGGGGDDGGRDALLRRVGQPGPSSSSTPDAAAAAAASPSSSGRAGEAGDEGGGEKPWGRRRKRRGKRAAVARAFRDGLPAAAASCWRGVTAVEGTGGGRAGNRRRDDGAADGSGRRGNSSGEAGPGPGTGAAAVAWCCVCPGGDCSLETDPSANGKEDPGVRSLLERNDFFSADCNPHADGLASSAGASW